MISVKRCEPASTASSTAVARSRVPAGSAALFRSMVVEFHQGTPVDGALVRGTIGVAMPQTLAEKIWERHLVHRAEGEPDLLYVDLHLVHEVTSPQAFEGLRLAGRRVRRPDLTRRDDGPQRADRPTGP